MHERWFFGTEATHFQCYVTLSYNGRIDPRKYGCFRVTSPQTYNVEFVLLLLLRVHFDVLSMIYQNIRNIMRYTATLCSVQFVYCNVGRWRGGVIGRASDLLFTGRRFDHEHHRLVALGKLLPPVCLYHQPI